MHTQSQAPQPQPQPAQPSALATAHLPIDDSAPSPPPSGLPKKRPGLLVANASRGILSPSLSALATARVIDNLSKVPYPDGIKCPDAELNTHAKDGKFRSAALETLPFLSPLTHSYFEGMTASF
jgi:hypothetical protein